MCPEVTVLLVDCLQHVLFTRSYTSSIVLSLNTLNNSDINVFTLNNSDMDLFCTYYFYAIYMLIYLHSFIECYILNIVLSLLHRKRPALIKIIIIIIIIIRNLYYLSNILNMSRVLSNIQYLQLVIICSCHLDCYHDKGFMGSY